MTALSTDKLKALLAAITPGPWSVQPVHVDDEGAGMIGIDSESWLGLANVWAWVLDDDEPGVQVSRSEGHANAEAIALVPDLIRQALADRKAEAWQPIETAPLTDEYSPLMLLWVPHDLGGYIFVGTRNAAGNWIDNLIMDDHQPTHWQPLPDPPTTPEAEGGSDAE